jgi:TldD protein
MENLTSRALNLAQLKGAAYADIRIVRREVEIVRVKNGHVDSLSSIESQGFGVRVIVDGAWGFASSSTLAPAEVDRVTALAVQIARASVLVKREETRLDSPRQIAAQYHTPMQIDPFRVPREEKINILMAADAAMRKVPGIRVAEGSTEAWRETKTFASTDGSYIEQVITETGAGIECLAVSSDDVQKRSYPNSFGRHQATKGFELIHELDLPGHAEQIAAEAVQLLTAKPCPNVVTTLILGPTQLALQVHESCGHPIELDRVFGTEASYAGTSFLTLDKLGRFRYGSEVVNITADATIPGGLGTFGFDDEGVPAQRTPIVRHGLFVGYLTSRETAARLGQSSNGTARADGWNRIPIIRMTNVNLEPGTWDFDDLIADTDDGIYMELNKSWSIDDKRLNFQFGTEIAYEIKNGKFGAMLKNATYTGLTPQFWGSCDAICNAGYWNVWGTPNCGKGQPPQIAHVGHGAAPARFRNVQVGVRGG